MATTQLPFSVIKITTTARTKVASFNNYTRANNYATWQNLIDTSAKYEVYPLS